MIQLHEDAIDDILYLARVNETAELDSFLAELSTQHNCSKADILSAAVDPESGNTALHYAAANGHLGTLTTLATSLSTPPNPPHPLINTPNKSGNTPLHWAALNGHLSTVQFLIKAGANVTVVNNAGHDAVFEAEINEKKEVAEWLLGAVAELEKGIAGSRGGDGADGDGEMEDVTVRMGDMGTKGKEG